MKFVYLGTLSYITLDGKLKKFVNGEHYETQTDAKVMKELGFAPADKKAKE